MGIRSTVAALAVGAVAYRAWNHLAKTDGAQGADEKAPAGGGVDYANREGLTQEDETNDQSFPASDPPARY